MTLKELWDQKSIKIGEAENEYLYSARKELESFDIVEKVVRILNCFTDFIEDDGFRFQNMGQVFRTRGGYLDDNKILYYDDNIRVFGCFEYGYFQVLGLTDDQYTELKRRVNFLTCEW